MVWLAVNLVQGSLADEFASPLEWGFPVGVMAASLGITLLIRSGRLPPAMIVRFGLVYQVRRRADARDASSATRSAMRFQPPGARDLVRLTLAYRPPLAWDALVDQLRREAIPDVDLVHERRYGRTVRIGGRRGVLFAEDAPATPRATGTRSCMNVEVSPSLVPALMPLLARLRQLFDLDAEPTTIDAHLERAGLGPLVRQRRGLRILGALDGFEAALRLLLRAGTRSEVAACQRARRVAVALGEPIETGFPGLGLLLPDETRVADAGVTRLAEPGVARRRAEGIVAIARAVADGTLRLEPGSNASATIHALMQIGGISEQAATAIVMRALYWPDAFSGAERHLQRAAGVSSRRALRTLAEQWRPWRAYAALHLGLREGRVAAGHPTKTLCLDKAY